VLILAVDTALGACSAAVVNDGRVLAHEHRAMQRGHAEALAPMVETLMREARVRFDALDRVGVTTGPGTFTGQRVGIAFARALGLALKKPVIGVTTLDVMMQEALTKSPGGAWSIACADAKRNEIYFAACTQQAALVPPELIALHAVAHRVGELAKSHGEKIALAGTAAPAVAALLHEAGLQPIDSLVRQPDAVFVAALAALASEGPPPKPLYLRPPDAKRPGEVS
jgi:tRNA threonylcarbamoyladenosine biosynthesis protein TsaB